jgi:pyruvyl transferase EpsO
LGTLALLTRLNDRRPAYVATLKGFDAKLCRELIGDGTVYFLGGGNLGDLYGTHHALRLAAMDSLPGNPIALLPQSFLVAGNDQNLLQETRRVYNHPRRTLFVRDHASVETAAQMLDMEATLCPDLAFGLGPLPRGPSTIPVLKFFRSAGESERKDSNFPSDEPGLGWRDSPAVMAWRRGGRFLDLFTRNLDPGGTGLSLRSRRFFAEKKLAAGTRFLSRGQYVITDRLHGHILSILLGIPHTLLDNATGKNKGYWEIWTRELSFVRYAESMADCVVPEG